MFRKLVAPASVAAIGGIVLAIALVAFVPSARLYAPLPLLIPFAVALVSWRQSADDERHRSAFDNYAFREITRMQRKRVEGW
jgi:hypothetical protein